MKLPWLANTCAVSIRTGLFVYINCMQELSCSPFLLNGSFDSAIDWLLTHSLLLTGLQPAVTLSQCGFAARDTVGGNCLLTFIVLDRVSSSQKYQYRKQLTALAPNRDETGWRHVHRLKWERIWCVGCVDEIKKVLMLMWDKPNVGFIHLIHLLQRWLLCRPAVSGKDLYSTESHSYILDTAVTDDLFGIHPTSALLPYSFFTLLICHSLLCSCLNTSL